MATIRYCFFDAGMTLIGKPGQYEAVSAVLKDHGFPVQSALLSHVHRRITAETRFPVTTTQEFYRAFNTMLLEALGIQPTEELVGDMYASFRGVRWKPFPDTDILSALPVPVGIISNWDESLPRVLRELFPDIRFDPVITSYGLGYAKPDLEIFRHALSSEGLSPKDVVYVGDSEELDIIPAVSLGIRAFRIDRTASQRPSEGVVINSLRDILPYLHTP